MDVSERERQFEAARAVSRRRMITLAPVWGPVFIVVGVRQLLRELPWRTLPTRSATAQPAAVQVIRFGLMLTAGLTTIFTAVLVGWLAFGLPPEGFARIPVALLAASLASSLSFFPLVLVAAVVDMGATQKRAQRGTSQQS